MKHKKRHFLKQIVFLLASKHYFSAAIEVFEKCPFLCPSFLESTHWAKMVHAVLSRLKQTPKKLWNRFFFFPGIWFLLQSNKPCLLLGGENQNFLGTLVFLVQKMLLFEKQTGDIWKSYFSAGFEVFALDLLTLSLFSWFLLFDFLFWLLT